MQRVVVPFLILVLIFFMLPSSIRAQERLILSRIEGDYVEDYCEKILRESYQRIGIQVEFKEFPPKRALIESNSGQTDGFCSR